MRIDRMVRGRRSPAWGLALAITLGLLSSEFPGRAVACNVPVFRYALEHWAADHYQLVLFHRGPLAAEQQNLIQPLKLPGIEPMLNLDVKLVDVAGEIPEEVRPLWDAQHDPALPYLVLNFPPAIGQEKPIWSGPLNAGTVGALVNSPVRKKVVGRLTKGDSAVWLLVECGEKTRDDAAAAMLDEQSRELEKTLKLPDLTPSDPAVSTSLPVRIAFSTVRFARNDPAEALLLAQLAPVLEARTTATDPVVFAVMGRGRALPPVAGENISAEKIHFVAEFLAGECSCEAKALNPGFDLLLNADWNAAFAESSTTAPEPPLTGLSRFAAQAANVPPASSIPPVPTKSLPVVAEAGLGLDRVIMLTVMMGIFGVALGTLILKTRAARSRK